MSITAEQVRQLRERTGAGMMECKKALVETAGDLDSAAELMRKQGLAKADKKASRVAAEGVIAAGNAGDARTAVLVEVNCETDFVAREAEFREFAASVAAVARAANLTDLTALGNAALPAGGTVDEARRALVAKIGENISIRRVALLTAPTHLGVYLHGSRIGTLVALEGGSEELARERAIAIDQLKLDPKNANKPEAMLGKIVEGKVAKVFAEQALLTQLYVKDDKLTVEKLLKSANARVSGFVRFEVGAGIEKVKEDYVAEIQKQVRGAG